MLVIDTNLIGFIDIVASLITVVCVMTTMYISLQNKANIQSLTLQLELRMAQLISSVEKKANAEGQMQGRDWATKNTNAEAAAVIMQAANVAAKLVTTTANTKKEITSPVDEVKNVFITANAAFIQPANTTINKLRSL